MSLTKRFTNTRWVPLIALCLVLSHCDKKTGSGEPIDPGTTPNTFANPLLASGPDPWIIRKDNQYYYTHTLGNRISVWKTGKVTELRTATPKVIWTAPASGEASQNVWAPEMHFLDGKWYTYFAAGTTGDHATQRSYVLENESADPTTGTWVNKGKIYDPAADFFAIDGTVFELNGSMYFLYSGHASLTDVAQRIYIAKMSNPWTLETGRVLLHSPTMDWEMVGSPPAVAEGPEIITNAAGRVFLVYSASGCWTDDYKLGMLTLTAGADPMNPSSWTTSAQPVFTKNASGAVFGPGHNSFFKSLDGNEDWILYHANTTAGAGCGDGRSPRIQKFGWKADGSPDFGVPVATGSPITKPGGE